MATQFGIKQVKNVSPAWVVGFLAAITIILQGVPQVINASTILDQHTKDVIGLVCDVSNIIVAAFSPLFGTNSVNNANDTSQVNG